MDGAPLGRVTSLNDAASVVTIGSWGRAPWDATREVHVDVVLDARPARTPEITCTPEPIFGFDCRLPTTGAVFWLWDNRNGEDTSTFVARTGYGGGLGGRSLSAEVIRGRARVCLVPYTDFVQPTCQTLDGLECADRGTLTLPREIATITPGDVTGGTLDVHFPSGASITIVF